MRAVTIAAMAFGWASGRPGVEAILYMSAVVFPEGAACAVTLLLVRSLRHARSERGSEVLLLVRLAAELRAGATLRGAVIQIGDASSSLTAAAALAEAGRPMPEVLEAAVPALGRFGGIAAAALRMAASTGGVVAPVVEQLVAQVMALDDLHRERRAAMAPVMLQAVIVGGVPLVTLLVMAVSGRLVALAAQGPWQTGMVLLGAALVLSGSALVARIAVRSDST